jgi:hypothetical protein
MAARYSDQEIKRLIKESKPLPRNYQSRIQLREKRGHKERELDIIGADGNEFRLIFRLSTHNQLDFSIILAFCPPDTSQAFRLRRYNGKSHEHTNIIENASFYDFHIHQATERYQDLGTREDAYAEPSDRYSDFHSALVCLMEDCHIEATEDSQLSLFKESES